MEDTPEERPQLEVFPESVVERLSLVLSIIALMVMPAVILAEVFLRAFFGISLHASYELGGYLVVAIGFFSLAICQIRGAFHGVQFVLQRRSPRDRKKLLLVYDLISLFFMLVMLWQLIKLVQASWIRGSTSIESLFGLTMTPLWMPQAAMPIGVLLLCLTLLRMSVIRINTLKNDGKDEA